MNLLLCIFALVVLPLFCKSEDVKINLSSLKLDLLNKTEEEKENALYTNCSAECEKEKQCIGITLYKEDSSDELQCLNSVIPTNKEENKTIIYRAILKSKLKKVRHLPYTKRRQSTKSLRAKRLTRSTTKRDLREEEKESIFPILSPKSPKDKKITFSPLPQTPTNPIIETEKDEEKSESDSSDYDSENEEDLSIQKLDHDLNEPKLKIKLIPDPNQLIVSTPKPNQAHVDPNHPDLFKEVEDFEDKNHLKLSEPVQEISEKIKSPEFVANEFEKDLKSKLKENHPEGISESEPELSKEEILEVLGTKHEKSGKKKNHDKNDVNDLIDERFGETSTTSDGIETTEESGTEQTSTISSFVLTPEEQVTLFPQTDADEIRKILASSINPGPENQRVTQSFKSKKIPFKLVSHDLQSKSTTLKPLTLPLIPPPQNMAVPPMPQGNQNIVNQATISTLASPSLMSNPTTGVHMVQVPNPFNGQLPQNSQKAPSNIVTPVQEIEAKPSWSKSNQILPQLIVDSHPVNVIFDKSENHPLFFKIPIIPNAQERFPQSPQIPQVKEIQKASATDEACLFEDRELFKRFLTAITFGFLDGTPMMISFIENSHCLAAFNKTGSEVLLPLRRVFKDFPQNEKVVAAGTFNDSIYLFDSSHNQRVWKYPIGLSSFKLENSPETLSLSKIDFLTSVCGFDRNDKFFGPMEIEAFYEVPKGDGSSGCILFDKTRDPLMTPKVSFESISLVDSIRALLESEFVNFVRGVFSWGDEMPAKSFYVYGSNGELYGIHRNEKSRTGGGWMQPFFTSVPYEVFPHAHTN